jgi:hypothetical protein
MENEMKDTGSKLLPQRRLPHRSSKVRSFSQKCDNSCQSRNQFRNLDIHKAQHPQNLQLTFIDAASVMECHGDLQPLPTAICPKTVTIPANPGKPRVARTSVTTFYLMTYDTFPARRQLSGNAANTSRPCKPEFSERTVTIPANPEFDLGIPEIGVIRSITKFCRVEGGH